jgi:hypothetical protein
MKYFLRAFTPTKNRRLNELVGFLLFVSATLLFLALASYSPLDPSLNTAGSVSSGSAHNWIGLFGAMLSDLLLQSVGVFVFAAPLMIGLLGARWFKSRPVASPGAKALGAAILLIFTPALLGLLPGHLRWMHAVAMEGLLGRIVGDVLLHYFNTLRDRGGRGALSLDGILICEHADLAEYSLCLCSGAVAALPGLARGAGQGFRTEKGRERSCESSGATQRQRAWHDLAGGPIGASTGSGGCCGEDGNRADV